MFEIVEKFCTSKERAKLLHGLNGYRKHLFEGGFVAGTQWLDGSFIEDVERTRGRPPRDIDVVTLFERPTRYQGNDHQWSADFRQFIHRDFFSSRNMKPRFNCDTYAIDLTLPPSHVVKNTTYWFGLFSDMRTSHFKKGIVEIALADQPSEFRMIEGEIRRCFDV
ncbi:hypothetical protein P2H44_03110 [Albimonas sp. CAU 1670]|uniref:DUF6932 family protein n=1 Tax=Albimonas sp. CAU 1670 TaxID=3032599 RepID=UPI0023DBF633|nr:hypothetical protein [Albimonas sp. CAU 1670]MDF2231534.1 hypothetical protein [Albimonas sp. CAU 1670]